MCILTVMSGLIISSFLHVFIFQTQRFCYSFHKFVVSYIFNFSLIIIIFFFLFVQVQFKFLTQGFHTQNHWCSLVEQTGDGSVTAFQLCIFCSFNFWHRFSLYCPNWAQIYRFPTPAPRCTTMPTLYFSYAHLWSCTFPTKSYFVLRHAWMYIFTAT